MTDKKSAVAVILSILVVMVYSELFIAPKTRPAQPPAQTTATLPQTTQTAAPTNMLTPTSGSAATPQIAITQAAAPVTETIRNIDTPLLKVEISNIGGRVKSLQLKNYKHTLQDSSPLDLVSVRGDMPKPFGVYVGTASDSGLAYTFEDGSNGIANLGAGENASITLSTTINGAKLSKTFTFDGSSYFIGVKVDGEALKTADTTWLEWTSMLPPGKIAQPHLLGFSTLKGQEVEHTILPSIKEEGLKSKDGLTWAAFSDQYFLSALVGNTPAPGRIGKIKLGTEELLVAQLAAPSSAASFSVYAGPKDYRLLKELGHDLHRTVDLGFFAFLAQPLLWLLRNINSLLNNWGLSIIALTLLLKSAFLPLTKASFTSMKAMQEVAPEIKALRERISDPTQLNQEMIALYKRRGVNPLGGCFPVLIQIPVFLGLYNALLHTIELRHAPFALWIHDLSAPEWLSLGFISIPVLVVLMTALMVIQQALTPSPDPTQKKMMMVMSLAFSFIFINFPAGLTLYWLVNSLISVVQQKVITKGSRISPALATTVGSLVIFGGAFILTRL